MIRVLSTGFYATIQDLGRYGYQDFGVPYSGAMDQRAAQLANALLGNKVGDAVLEQTMTGATLRFDCDTYIAITGADMHPRLNEQPLELNKMIQVGSGSILSFGASKRGFRCYLAVSGGFKTTKILGSRSMYSPVTKKNAIQKGDVLKISKLGSDIQMPFSHLRVDTSYLESKSIEVYEGPEFEFLNADQKNFLFSTVFHISKNNNRMAYQLEETLPNDLKPILTSGVFPGTVQLTPSGKLIVLMRDCQTTGGYPRVLQLSDEAITHLAQKYQGKSFNFKLLKY